HTESFSLRVAAVSRRAAAFFLCHDKFLFKTRLRELSRYGVDTDFGVVLTMALRAAIAFAAAHLKHLDFVVTALRKNSCCDRCTGDQGSADFQLLAFANR